MSTSSIDYQRLYSYRFRDVDQASREAVWREIAQFIYQRLRRPATILDPAAGRGEFITAVPAAERWGVDLVSQGDLESAGVKMIIADIMDAELPMGHFDGVFVSNFLEHLPDQNSVAALLSKLRDSMAPGGRIAIMGPNFKYCAREYFDCADHTLILSHVGLEEHLHAAGFEIDTMYPKFLPYSFRGLLPPSPALTRTYLNNPLMWKVLGKQFLAIARKPAA
jgi:SAM-dependent methyltransferase